MVTGYIQLGCCKDVRQGVIVCVHINGQPIQVFVELFDYDPLEGEKIPTSVQVEGLSLGQDPTGTGYYRICAIVMGLVENSSQTRPTGISIELERLGEICVGKNRCSGTQSFQVIKGLSAPAVPLDGSFFLASVLTQG